MLCLEAAPPALGDLRIGRESSLSAEGMRKARKRRDPAAQGRESIQKAQEYALGLNLSFI